MSQATLKNERQTKLTEEDILNSLDNAIKAYSKKDFSPVLNNILPDFDLPEVTQKPIKQKTLKKSKKGAKNKVKKSRTSGLSFFRKSFKKNSQKIAASKAIKSKKNKFEKVNKFYSQYRKQIVTSTLSLAMLSFVVFSSYIAYAYVSSANLDILAKVSQHVVLPVGETPKVYIIQSEKSEIFQNPLFKGIQIGDNVLSYTNSSKVIIYRSKEDKIVNIVNTTQ